jgi:hypothetical protein
MLARETPPPKFSLEIHANKPEVGTILRPTFSLRSSPWNMLNVMILRPIFSRFCTQLPWLVLTTIQDGI